MKVVKVKWIDCERTFGWIDRDAFMNWMSVKSNPMVSVGFLASDIDDHIVLLQTVGDDQMGEAIQIPRALILELEELADTDIEL
jgi:hypothetical protein